MIKEINLWNVTKKKTSMVLNYVQKLEEKPYWKSSTIEYFKKVKRSAEIATTPNEALELIGYNHNDICDLIIKCDSMN